MAEAIADQAKLGTHWAAQSELEIDVAERIQRMLPAAELVRFNNSATEVVGAAFRLARAHTGRPLILRFERWARERLRDGFSLQDAAKALATSPRSLQRRCSAVLGKSPLAYFQDLRVERAQALVRGGGRDLEAIAAEVGYLDGATLRTLLRQRLGRGVRELRTDLQ